MHPPFRTALCALVCAALLAVPAAATDQMIPAVKGTPFFLGLIGWGGITGTGIQIGVIEASQGVPLATNPFFVGATIANIPQGVRPADLVTNHASEVTGVIVSQAPQPGIAPGASIQAAGHGGAVESMLNMQDAARAAVIARAPILNLSFGGGGATNGTTLRTRWVDWAARSGAAPVQDLLFVIAGNEGSAGTKSDSYNSINVCATGRRLGGIMTYDREATYNTTNVTTDLSPITGLGRIKTDICAPGGDPGPTANPPGTFAAPPTAENRFVTAGGGVWEFMDVSLIFGAGNTSVPPGATFPGLGTCPPAPGNTQPCAVYTIDDFNMGGLTSDAYLALDNTAPRIALPAGGYPAINPGANLGGTDALATNSIAGTSFAAPMVSGAAALLHQYGAANALSLDHRVIKAVLLNGASKQNPNNNGPLLRQNGLTPWTRALAIAAGFTKPDPLGGVGATVPIQVGLDPALGTGQLDVIKSALNYRAGEHNPGAVPPIGYDLHTIAPNTRNSYTFTAVAGSFTATLCWDRTVTLGGEVIPGNGLWDTEDVNVNGVLDAGEDLDLDGVLDMESLTASALNDLDLELYRIPAAGAPIQVDISTSDIDNVEHLFATLIAGNYRLDVVNRSGNTESYGLAWFVPEPTCLVLLLGAGAAVTRRRRPER